MRDFRNTLLSKAFTEISGEEYNQVSWEMRQEHPERSRVFYEVVLDQNSTWQHLRDRVYPTFARYLKFKGKNPVSAAGTVVSVFYGDRCYLMEGSKFLSVYKEIEDLDASRFHLRVRGWLGADDHGKVPLLPAGRTT